VARREVWSAITGSIRRGQRRGSLAARIRDILLVSYATQTEPSIASALHAAASRGVEITILAERHDDDSADTAVGVSEVRSGPDELSDPSPPLRCGAGGEPAGDA
jgi:hypothetical protein